MEGDPDRATAHNLIFCKARDWDEDPKPRYNAEKAAERSPFCARAIPQPTDRQTRSRMKILPLPPRVRQSDVCCGCAKKVPRSAGCAQGNNKCSQARKRISAIIREFFSASQANLV